MTRAEFRDADAVDILHRVIRLAVARLAAVEERRDVRMHERREDLPLVLEAFAILARRERTAHDFQRDLLRETALAARREVDRAHAARADEALHAIVADVLADQRVVL